EVFIEGVSVQQNREKALPRVGAIFEAPAFYDYLSGWHNLKSLAAYSGGVSDGLIQEMVEWVGLSSRIRDRVSTYSHGMRQRLALAQALLPRPELLVLDEPTDGLDPEGIVEFRKQLLELRDRLGLTVLLSSHLLSEVEQLCDEVVILKGGKKVYAGGVDGFEQDFALFRIASENEEETREMIVQRGGRVEGSRYTFPKSINDAELLASLIADGAQVCSFRRESTSLEEFYLTAGDTQRKTEGGKS
ncbi:UNVERIFIED_CONTAM: hypothetical protein GTU68_010023, partial [Idotea baltica]|nr:hypothetical protein [Idotea baltica]